MSTLTLSPNQKLQIITLIDNTETSNNVELAELTKDFIPNITWRHLVPITSSYKKDKFGYKTKQQKLIAKLNGKELKDLSDILIDSISTEYGKIKNTANDPFRNANGANKAIARQIMSNFIIESGVVGSVLTLPHIKCVIEQMVLKGLPKTTFVACELKKEVLNGMRKTIRTKNLPIVSHNKPISEFIYGVSTDTYAHLILDYCGTIGRFHKEISYAMQNNLVKVGGTISATFCTRKAHPSEIDYLQQSYSELDQRTPNERMITNFFIQEGRNNYIIDKVFNYTDDSSMLLVTVKRIK